MSVSRSESVPMSIPYWCVPIHICACGSTSSLVLASWRIDGGYALECSETNGNFLKSRALSPQRLYLLWKVGIVMCVLLRSLLFYYFLPFNSFIIMVFFILKYSLFKISYSGFCFLYELNLTHCYKPRWRKQFLV